MRMSSPLYWSSYNNDGWHEKKSVCVPPTWLTQIISYFLSATLFSHGFPLSSSNKRRLTIFLALCRRPQTTAASCKVNGYSVSKDDKWVHVHTCGAHSVSGCSVHCCVCGWCKVHKMIKTTLHQCLACPKEAILCILFQYKWIDTMCYDKSFIIGA